MSVDTSPAASEPAPAVRPTQLAVGADSGTALVIRDASQYLATVREIRVLAQRIESIEDAKVLAGKAAAAKVWAERARLGTDQVNLAAVAKLWAERRAGELLPTAISHGGDRRSASSSQTATLNDLGVTKDESSRWQKLAAVPADDFEAAIEQVADEGVVVSTARVVAVLGSSESDEWYTPADYTDAARFVMGGIDLDPASCARANEVVKAKRFYSIEDDGLMKKWKGRVFMNPPFGRDGSPAFVAKLLAEYAAGNIESAILLCAARLETQWFQPLFDHTLCFPNHRVRFWQPGRNPAPPFTPAFAYLGPAPDAFVRGFATFGPIVRRIG